MIFKPASAKPFGILMILITGGGGNIGQYVVAELASSRENKIRLFLRSKLAYPAPPGVELFYGDLSNEQDIKTALMGVDTVVHVAGLVAFHVSKRVLFAANVEATERLARCAAAAGVKEFIHTSSIAVYGKGIDGKVVDSTFPANPDTLYGLSKLASEQALGHYSGRMHITILRLGVVYGEGIMEGYSKMLTYLQQGKMRIIGNGDNHIPFVYAKDAARAYSLALDPHYQYASGTAFNIIGDELTQKEIFEIASGCLGVKPPQSRVSKHLALFLARFKVALAYFHAGSLKSASDSLEMLKIMSADRQINYRWAQKYLGWGPKTSLAQGITLTVAKFKKGEMGEK